MVDGEEENGMNNDGAKILVVLGLKALFLWIPMVSYAIGKAKAGQNWKAGFVIVVTLISIGLHIDTIICWLTGAFEEMPFSLTYGW